MTDQVFKWGSGCRATLDRPATALSPPDHQCHSSPCLLASRQGEESIGGYTVEQEWVRFFRQG